MLTRSIYCCGCECVVYARLTSGVECYPRRRDLHGRAFYRCDTCGGFVGTHKGTYKPLGTIPNKEIKEARIHIHNLIDPLWKNKLISRNKLYKRMAKELDIEEYHTAELSDIETARDAWRAGKKLEGELLEDIRRKGYNSV